MVIDDDDDDDYDKKDVAYLLRWSREVILNKGDITDFYASRLESPRGAKGNKGILCGVHEGCYVGFGGKEVLAQWYQQLKKYSNKSFHAFLEKPSTHLRSGKHS